MKTITYFFLLIPALAFAQSKKELKAQLEKQFELNKSINAELIKAKVTEDSLLSVISENDKTILIWQKNTLKAENELSNCKSEINRLNQELKKSKETGSNQNHTNTPSTKPTNKFDDNPFGSSGRGNGSIDGNGLGKGGSIGTDNNSTPGNGKTYGMRTMIQRPNATGINSDENCKITLTVVVDENGEIVGTPEVDKSKTTTTNQALLNQVAAVVKSQTKYNVVKGAANMNMSLVIRIEAN